MSGAESRMKNSSTVKIDSAANSQKPSDKSGGRPSTAQLKYLKMGLDQPGGKLPLFDIDGQEIKPATIRSCVEKGWAEPWFHNPVMPNWLVCKLTDAGQAVATQK
ncbi:MAG: hypothetical protein WBC71_03240 [Salaquimonas sp.]